MSKTGWEHKFRENFNCYCTDEQLMEIEEFIADTIRETEELINNVKQIVIEDVPHQYQLRLLELLNKEVK